MNASLTDSSLQLICHLKPRHAITGVLFSRHFMTCEISKSASINYYQGAYEIVPSSEEQIISTQNKFVSRDIVVKPVPAGFGRIGWNGSYLLVS